MNRRLTAIEYRELVTLEYVLTWMYTDDYESDLARLAFSL